MLSEPTLVSIERYTNPGFGEGFRQLRNKLGRLVTAALLVVSSATATFTVEETVHPTSAHADTFGYPWSDASYVDANYDWGYSTCPSSDSGCMSPFSGYLNGVKYGESDPWGYYLRNCTSYVAWKLNSIGVSPSKFRGLGNGGDWYNNATTDERSTVPAPWDAAVAPGTKSNPFGHLAFVESVNADGTITVSEYNHDMQGNGDIRTGTAASMGFTEFVDFGVHPQTSGGGTAKYSDFGIYRASEGKWYVKDGPGGNSYITNGLAHGGYSGDVPLVGDFNGDHKDDFVIYRQGMWYVKDSNGNFIGPGPNGLSHGGWPGDIPLVGDVDGNGIDDFIIYRPSQGRWYTKSGPTGSTYISDVAHGGWPGDIPLVGDIDGNGTDDFIIYRPSQGRWYTKAAPGGETYISDVTHGGWAGDIPLVGNFNHDRYDDFVIYRNGTWYVRPGPGGTLPDGTMYIGPGPNGLAHGGWAGDIPLIGDIDGNGTDDYIIYRPSQGRWYTKAGPGGETYISDVTHGGHADDVPLVGNFG